MVFQHQDAWRKHPLFTGLWKSPLPGLRNAVAIYAVYMAGEIAYKAAFGAPKLAHDEHH